MRVVVFSEEFDEFLWCVGVSRNFEFKAFLMERTLALFINLKVKFDGLKVEQMLRELLHDLVEIDLFLTKYL